MLVTRLLFPAEKPNIQEQSLQISLMSLHLFMNLPFCGGGACHNVPQGLLQGMLSPSASIARDAFSLVQLDQVWFFGERRGLKSFLGDERGLWQKAKIILNVIRQCFFVVVF